MLNLLISQIKKKGIMNWQTCTNKTINYPGYCCDEHEEENKIQRKEIVNSINSFQDLFKPVSIDVTIEESK
jgi:hypothetical protein